MISSWRKPDAEDDGGLCLPDAWEAAQWPAGFQVRRKPVAGLRLMTLNLGLLGIRLFGRARVALAEHVDARVAAAPRLIREVGADVVALQEIFSKGDQLALSRALRDIYPYSTAAASTVSLLGSGLMFLSRRPLRNEGFVRLAAGHRLARLAARRGYLWAEIDCPGFGTMALINLHLTAAADSGAPSAQGQRRAEVIQLLDLAESLEHPAILIGDFNTSPLISPALYGTIVERGFRDAVAAGRDAATLESLATWDPANALNIKGRYRHAPRQRIDHVFLADAIARRGVVGKSGIVLDQPCVATRDGLVPLSDHFGVTVDLVARDTVDAAPATRREAARHA